MKKSIQILAVLSIMGFISCKPISMFVGKKTGEFIQPQNETKESIKSYCQEKKVKYDKLIMVGSQKEFSSFIGKYKHLPSVFIFNKNKYLITTAEKTDCPWAMINLLDHNVVESKIVQDTLLFDEILSNFSIVDSISGNQNADYYILCTWAKFAPKMTDAVFATINKQKEEHKINVCHILLNVDLQEGWDSK